MKQALLITLTALMLGGCATEEFSTGMTATSHYMASGHVGTAKAWVYAQRTIFEGRAGQEYLFSTTAGEPIKAEKIGDYLQSPFTGTRLYCARRRPYYAVRPCSRHLDIYTNWRNV